jgi:hypothetical protein
MTSIAATNTPSLPPPTTQTAAMIGGQHTEVTRICYADSEFWIITQVGKIGSIVKCAKQIGVTGKETIICETLFGKREDPMCDLFARVMAEKILTATMKPITLGFALKNIGNNSEDLRAIVKLACTLL